MARLIDTMIVGVEKAGTTSLLRYLSEHPDVASHAAMEMPYFVNDEIYRKGWEKSFKEYFVYSKNHKILLAKSVGCMYWEHVPKRLHDHNPDLKLIAVLRNPVERAYSAYWYALQMGREDKNTFEEAILAEDERLETGDDFHLRYHAYLRRGLYGQQLNRLFQFFDSAQVKIITFEALKKNPARVVNDLFEFLGVNPVQVNVGRRHNETSGERNKILSWLEYQNPILRKSISSFIPINLKNKIKSLFEEAGSKQKIKIPSIDKQTEARLLKFYEDDAALLQRLINQKKLPDDPSGASLSR